MSSQSSSQQEAQPPPNKTEDTSEDNATDAADAARVEELLLEIVEGIHELEARRSRSLVELQQVAVELAVAVASHVIREKLEAGEMGVDRLVRDAISRLSPDDPMRIHVNPLDEAELAGALKDQLDAGTRSTVIVADPDVPRGGCQVTAGDFGLLSTLQQRLETIRESLLQGIEHAQTERRKTRAGDGGVRRFPERRQTA